MTGEQIYPFIYVIVGALLTAFFKYLFDLRATSMKEGRSTRFFDTKLGRICLSVMITIAPLVIALCVHYFVLLPILNKPEPLTRKDVVKISTLICFNMLHWGFCGGLLWLFIIRPFMNGQGFLFSQNTKDEILKQEARKEIIEEIKAKTSLLPATSTIEDLYKTIDEIPIKKSVRKRKLKKESHDASIL